METIYVLPGGTAGRHRDPTTGDWVDGPADPDLVDTPAGNRGRPLEVWNLEPRTGGDTQDDVGSSGYRAGWVVYGPHPGPAGVPRPVDRFEVRGVVYGLVGVVGDWTNGLAPGVLDGLVFTLERGVG